MHVVRMSIFLLLMVGLQVSATNLNSVNVTGTPTESGNDITFSTSGTAKLKVTVCYPDVARFWVATDGNFSKDASYAIDKETWGTVTKTVTDKSTYFQILTSDLSIRINKSPLKISIYKADDVTLISDERSSGGIGWDNTGVFANWNITASEHFFGLGEDNSDYLGTLDRKGTIRTMKTGMNPRSGYTPSDFVVPFFMSTGTANNGYGVYYDNTYQATFDMGKTNSSTYSWKANGGPLVFYFMYGPDFKTILGKYTMLTGAPSMPPVWSLGYIQSKCTYWNWAQVDEVVSGMKTNKMPLEMMVLDYDWSNCPGNFTWGNAEHSGGATKVGTYKSSGIRIMVSNSGPMIPDTGLCASVYNDANSKGLFAKCGTGKCVAGYYKGYLLDATHPNYMSWLWSQNQVKHLYQEGVAGWWLDLPEPENEPGEATYTAGSSAKIHNVFSNYYSKAYYDGQKLQDANSRPYILTRCGFSGIQKYGTTLWSGDIFSDYVSLQAHVPESQSSGLSGIPWWTMDIGGFQASYNGVDVQYYKGSKNGAHALLYQRWFQFGCFTPITRSHGVKDCAPYQYTAEVTAGCKKYIDLRYRLLPYIYSYAYETFVTGLPIQRALVLEYQNDADVYGKKMEYLFGKEFLVAPVVDENATSKDVYFPEGKWIDYDDGTVYTGKTTKTVPAPQDKLPLFVKSGAILPMAQAQTQLTDATGAKKKWDPITFDIFPDGNSSFTMYNDDGLTQEFQTSSKFTTTEIKSSFALGSQEIVTITESNKQFTPAKYEFKIHLAGQTIVPSPIKWNDLSLDSLTSQTAYASASSGRFWDAAAKVLWVKGATTATSMNYVLSISLNGQAVSVNDLQKAGAFPKSFDMKLLQAKSCKPRIQIAVPFASPSLKIDLCNLQGRTVAVLAQGNLSAGYHTIGFNTPGNVAPTGWYFCRMKASGFNKTVKVLLTK